MSAAHEHAEDEQTLYSALGRPHPQHHDEQQVHHAATELLRIYGQPPDERTAA